MFKVKPNHEVFKIILVLFLIIQKVIMILNMNQDPSMEIENWPCFIYSEYIVAQKRSEGLSIFV